MLVGMSCERNCGKLVVSIVKKLAGVDSVYMKYSKQLVLVYGIVEEGVISQAIEAVGFQATCVQTTFIPHEYWLRLDDSLSLSTETLPLLTALQSLSDVHAAVLVYRNRCIYVTGYLCYKELLEALRPFEELVTVLTDASALELPQGDQALVKEADESHQCDEACVERGCPRYVATMAHQMASASGWSQIGCAMSWGGECTCGIGCKCVGCEYHQNLQQGEIKT